jgi:hypothetical protein
MWIPPWTRFRGDCHTERRDTDVMHPSKPNDRETLDSTWGIRPPERHICIKSAGFRPRQKIAFWGGSGCPTPFCVNYGGPAAIGAQTIQGKGSVGKPCSLCKDQAKPKHNLLRPGHLMFLSTAVGGAECLTSGHNDQLGDCPDAGSKHSTCVAKEFIKTKFILAVHGYPLCGLGPLLSKDSWKADDKRNGG